MMFSVSVCDSKTAILCAYLTVERISRDYIIRKHKYTRMDRICTGAARYSIGPGKYVVTADITALEFAALGGVSPVLRFEAMYEFDHVFKDAWETIRYESDFLRTGVGIDWKTKIPFLNSRAYINIMPQLFYDKIVDYPDGFELFYSPYEDLYSASLVLFTGYFNQKLQPEFAMFYDITHEAYMILPSITYKPNTSWSFKLMAGFFGGEKEGLGLQPFENKDYVGFKVKYKFN